MGEQLVAQFYRSIPEKQWLFQYGRVPLNFILNENVWKVCRSILRLEALLTKFPLSSGYTHLPPGGPPLAVKSPSSLKRLLNLRKHYPALRFCHLKTISIPLEPPQQAENNRNNTIHDVSAFLSRSSALCLSSIRYDHGWILQEHILKYFCRPSRKGSLINGIIVYAGYSSEKRQSSRLLSRMSLNPRFLANN
jgi:hypothetical protein